jgi:hypothetical protein
MHGAGSGELGEVAVRPIAVQRNRLCIPRANEDGELIAETRI